MPSVSVCQTTRCRQARSLDRWLASTFDLLALDRDVDCFFAGYVEDVVIIVDVDYVQMRLLIMLSNGELKIQEEEVNFIRL